MATEQLLTRPPTTTRNRERAAERLLRCARIEASLARALERGSSRATDPALVDVLRRHARRDERHAKALERAADPEGSVGDGGRTDPELRGWLEQLSLARSEIEALAGIYGVAKVVLADAYRELIAATDPERDRPRRRSSHARGSG